MVMIVKFKPAHKNNNSSAPLTLRNIGGVWREVPTYLPIVREVSGIQTITHDPEYTEV